jgi:hypothetical protein
VGYYFDQEITTSVNTQDVIDESHFIALYEEFIENGLCDMNVEVVFAHQDDSEAYVYDNSGWGTISSEPFSRYRSDATSIVFVMRGKSRYINETQDNRLSSIPCVVSVEVTGCSECRSLSECEDYECDSTEEHNFDCAFCSLRITRQEFDKD